MPIVTGPYRKPVEAEPGGEGAFSRDDFLVPLHTMTSSVTYPLVLAIDGVWGTGKTHLLRTWEIQLNREDRPYVYFNAWEHDHSEDPFISFMGVVRQALPKYEDDGGKIISFVQKAAKAVPGILSLGSRVLANVACKQAGIPTDFLDGKALYAAAQQQIESYQESHDSIDAFRKELERTAESIGNLWVLKRPVANSIQPTPERPPLLVLVDELDRCRPDFAVKLLERVKHLFNVPGLVFVFVVDMGQLQESTRTLYGRGMNSDGYFRRFFDLVIPLPELDSDQRLYFCSYIFEGLETITAIKNQSIMSLVQLQHCLGVLFNMSLRELSQSSAYCDLCLRSMPKDEDAWVLVLLLVAFRLKRNDVFDAAWNRSLQPSHIAGLFSGLEFDALKGELGFETLKKALYWLLFSAHGVGEAFWLDAKKHTLSLPEASLGRTILEELGGMPRYPDRRFQSYVRGIMSSVAMLIAAPSPSASGVTLS